MPLQPPWSDVGRLQRDISEVRNALNHKADSYEVDTLNSRVSGLERSIGEIRSEVAGLLSELQGTEERLKGDLR